MLRTTRTSLGTPQTNSWYLNPSWCKKRRKLHHICIKTSRNVAGVPKCMTITTCRHHLLPYLHGVQAAHRDSILSLAGYTAFDHCTRSRCCAEKLEIGADSSFGCETGHRFGGRSRKSENHLHNLLHCQEVFAVMVRHIARCPLRYQHIYVLLHFTRDTYAMIIVSVLFLAVLTPLFFLLLLLLLSSLCILFLLQC
jgi:hypothetical protein